MTLTTLSPESVGLRPSEYEEIIHRLGRHPSALELQLFGVMWSEHCGYKHSALTLRALPAASERLLLGPGENAGVLDIGDGWALALKIESHNHPSAVDPANGAATGVGGIIRDILAVGARPIALLDSLRFGPLDDPKSRRLLKGVVSGIAAYGNCVGVPTVAGEVMVDSTYRDNPLVNVACLGLVRHEAIAHARARGEGNLLLYVGARTGRDGIGGAAFASEELDERSEREDRASVQIGDPFTGKLLIEATLEALATGLVVAIQDMGAAGLICAASEMAARGRVGVVLDLDAVPLREEGMRPEEILRSESQERMLLVIHRAAEAPLAAIFQRWGLPAAVVGEVIAEPVIRMTSRGSTLAEFPAEALTAAPRYRPASRAPAAEPETLSTDAPVAVVDPEEALRALLASPDIASKRPVFTQYDHMVQVRTVVPPGGGDAAVLRLQEAPPKGVALTVAGDGRRCALDPYRGAQLAVAETATGLACVGAEPLGVTDCLNFGSPETPEVFWSFEQAVAGIANACRALDIPVVGGNVSFYNESPAGPIIPTPVIVMVGLVEDVNRTCRLAFREPGDLIALVGGTTAQLDGSQYMHVIHHLIRGRPPAVDFELHRRVVAVVRTAVVRQWLHSAHDCADGGLAVALAECVLAGGIGAEVTVPLIGRPGLSLFGEAPSRIVVSLPAAARDALSTLAWQWGVPVTVLGRTGGNRLRVTAFTDGTSPWTIDLGADELAAAYGALAEVV